MPRAKAKPVNRPIVIAVTSDQHAGSTVALCPPKILLDDGGEYHASKAQLWVWEKWLAYWERVRQVQQEHDAALWQVFNGDAVEGHHHRNTHVIANNPNAQALVWTEAVRVPLALGPEKVFVVRGTEAHVGAEGSAEERIAEGLWRDKRPVVRDMDSGAASWWHLRMQVDGLFLDFTHHGRTGQREHTRASNATLHAHDIFLSHAKNGERHPDLCIRSHYHRFNDSHDACPTRVVTIGAWQLKTGHVHKIAADTIADIGGAIIVIKDGQYTVEKVCYKPDRGSVWKPL